MDVVGQKMPTMVAGDGLTWTENTVYCSLAVALELAHVLRAITLGWERVWVIDVPVILQPLRQRKWHTQVKKQNLHV